MTSLLGVVRCGCDAVAAAAAAAVESCRPLAERCVALRPEGRMSSGNGPMRQASSSIWMRVSPVMGRISNGPSNGWVVWGW